MKNIVKIRVDQSCEMAEVYLNDKLVMSGNFWDFHPDCNGVRQYGDFKGYSDLARAIALSVGDCEIVKEKYSYEDEY